MRHMGSRLAQIPQNDRETRRADVPEVGAVDEMLHGPIDICTTVKEFEGVVDMARG
jgi:hypothetical protein